MKLKIDIHVWIVNASDVETASSTASVMSTLWDLGFIPFYPFKIPKLPLSKLKLTQQPWQESNSAATFSKGKKIFWSTANQTRGFGAKISFNEMRKFIKWKEYHIEGYHELARYKSQLFEQGHHIEGYPSFVQQ